MSAITAKASRKMKKYAVLTREPRCFLGSFDFSWEQRKAKEICSIGTGKSNTQDQVDDGKYPFYIRSDVPVRSNKYLYDCEAVITIGDGNIGKVFHYVNGKFDLHQRCYKMTDFKDIWGKYFFYYFSTKFYDRAMKMTAKATVDSVRLEMISEMDIKKPPQISEQKQIAEFFANLDNLITLHQRKCANLCSPSQVVFSLLFATSTFSWEQRKLGELVDRVVRKNINNESTLPLTISAQYGLVDQITYFNNRVASRDVSNYYLVLNGEFAYNKSTSDGYPFGAVKRLDLYEKGVLSTLYIVFAPKKEQQIDSDYLTVFFDTDRWHKGVAERAAEGARNHGLLNISAEDFFDIDLSVPKDIVEQKQIGAFIRQLDDLITLHQRECISFTGRADRLILTANKKRTTSSWEQRKFEEIAVRSSVICSDDTLPRVEYEDIVSGTGRLNKDIYAKQSIKSGIAFHQGDVLYGKLRPYLQNWLLPTFDGLAVGDFWVLQPQNADSSFLYRLIQSRQFDEVANQSTGTKMPRADWKLVSKTVFSIPSNISEQAAIGTYFTALDSLITLHQRECISFTARAGRRILTANKKRNTSSWEQRKFSELVQIERGGSPRPIDDFITDAPNGLNWVKIGDAPTQGNYITKTAEKIRPEGLSKTREVHPGDLILSNSMSFGKPYIMGIDGCIHDGWLLIRNTYGVFDLTFLCHLLGTPQMLSQYRSLAAGSTVNNLNKELVGNTYVTIPSITEQRVLGAYLEQLDNLITLHQRKPFLMKWRTSDANRNKTNRLVL